MTDIKRIDIKEFREKGYLQELNRQFLHPLGLAMEVIINEETGEETLGGVWDYRDDPEGMLYQDGMLEMEVFKNKVANVKKLYEEKAAYRKDKFGWVVQPIEKSTETITGCCNIHYMSTDDQYKCEEYTGDYVEMPISNCSTCWYFDDRWV